MAIEPVNERPIFPSLLDPKNPTTGTWSVSMIRQLTTVFQQYGYRLNHALLDENLASEGGNIAETDNSNMWTVSQIFQTAPTATGHPLRFDELAANGGTIPETDRSNTWTDTQVINSDSTNVDGWQRTLSAEPDTGGWDREVVNLDFNGTMTAKLGTLGNSTSFTWAYLGYGDATARSEGLHWNASNAFKIGSPTGGFQGASSLNAPALYVNGESVLDESTSGVVIQQAFTSTGAVVTSTTTLPYDDTIPQDTEGTEALSLSFTPKRSDSRIRIAANLQIRSSILNSERAAALFVSTQSGAIAAALGHGDTDASSTGIDSVSLVADVPSTDTSVRTFSARFGANNTSAIYLNANASGVRVFGGASASTLEITEYMP